MRPSTHTGAASRRALPPRRPMSRLREAGTARGVQIPVGAWTRAYDRPRQNVSAAGYGSQSFDRTRGIRRSVLRALVPWVDFQLGTDGAVVASVAPELPGRWVRPSKDTRLMVNCWAGS